MKGSRFSEEQIIGILKQSEAGVDTGELCRQHGISAATFYRWRSKYGGMDVSEAKRLKQLGGSELKAEADRGRSGTRHYDVEGSGRKKMVSPEDKRAAVALVRQAHGASERRACGTPQRALWASETMKHTADRCIMQADGNLVLYDPGNRALWASNSYGHAQSRLVMQDDGNLVIYAPSNTAVWASNTVSRLPPSGVPATGSQALRGQILAKDQGLQTANGRYTFVFQSDSKKTLSKDQCKKCLGLQ